MLVCLKCGAPGNGGICANCGSHQFRQIGTKDHSIYNNKSQSNIFNTGGGPVTTGIKPVNVGTSTAAAVGTAVAKKSTGKIIAILMSIIVVITAIAIPVTIKLTSNGPEKTIERLEKAYSEGDINGIIDCFDSKLRNTYEAGSNLLSGVLGFNLKDAAGLIPGMSSLMDEEMPHMDIEILRKEKTSSTTCTLDVRITFGIGENDNETEETKFDMVKEDGKWYISSDELFDELADELF